METELGGCAKVECGDALTSTYPKTSPRQLDSFLNASED